MDIVTYIRCRKLIKKYVKDLAGGMKYIGSVPTAADLPTPSESIKGHAYTTSDNGHEHVCDGTKWIDLSADLDRKQDKIEDLDTIRSGAALGATAIQTHQDISGKLNVLPKVDDPTDPGFGWEYHIPYRFDVSLDAEKANVDLHTLTLDNKVIKMKFSKQIPSATTSMAGLMSAADKTALNSVDYKIEMEATNRADADTLIRSDLDSEISARTSGDNALQESINQEAITREEADTTLQNNIDKKINLLGNVDDPSDPGYGWPYHFPYDATFSADADSINVGLKTITLDNNKSKMVFDKQLPSATTATAGLMSAADKTALDNKADKPPLCPAWLNPTGETPYPWFMASLDVESAGKGPDADGNLNVGVGAYNFNMKQYYKWDKSLPFAATTAKAGLMTAADKTKLDSAITEHQDISGKQDKLTAGTGIKLEGNTISADVRTYKPFPSSWPHGAGTTITSFCAAVNASYKSGEIKVGDAFLGNISSTAFFNGAYIEGGGSLGSAEVSVQIMTPFGQNCVQLLTTTSSNNAPYHWEYTYVDGATSEGWRCWSQYSYVNEKLGEKQDTLVSGTNIKTINNNSLLGNGNINILTYQPFPSDFEVNSTLSEFIRSVKTYSGGIKGMGFMGAIYGEVCPWGYGNAECKVEYLINGLALITVSSSNIAPYCWILNTAEGIWRPATLPVVPDNTKTYVLKAINGAITWVEE